MRSMRTTSAEMTSPTRMSLLFSDSSNRAAKDSMPAGAAVWVCMLVFPGVGPDADGVGVGPCITPVGPDGHGGEG